MSYSPKQLASAYKEKSKDGLTELILLDKVFSLDSFKKVFFNPKLTVEKKQAIIKDIFAENFSKNTLNFIDFLLEENSLKNFNKILNEFKKILRDEKIALSGTVTSVKTLTIEEIEKLEKDLEVKMSVPVVLEGKVDPELLGGVILEVDGLVYNNSYLHKLNKLKI